MLSIGTPATQVGRGARSTDLDGAAATSCRRHATDCRLVVRINYKAETSCMPAEGRGTSSASLPASLFGSRRVPTYETDASFIASHSSARCRLARRRALKRQARHRLRSCAEAVRALRRRRHGPGWAPDAAPDQAHRVDAREDQCPWRRARDEGIHGAAHRPGRAIAILRGEATNGVAEFYSPPPATFLKATARFLRATTRSRSSTPRTPQHLARAPEGDAQSTRGGVMSSLRVMCVVVLVACGAGVQLESASV